MEIKNPFELPALFPVRKSKKQKREFAEAAKNYLQNLGYEVAFEKGSFGAQNIVIGNPANAKYLITAHYDTCARMIIPNLITPCSLPLFLGYQILVSILMSVPAALIGLGIGSFFHSFGVGYYSCMVLLLAVIALMMFGPANPSNVNDNTSGVISVMEIARSLPENLRKDVCFVLFDLEEAGLIGSASYRKKHKQEAANQIVLNLDCVSDGDEIYFFPTRKLKKDAQKLELFEIITGKTGKKRITVHKKGFSIYPSDQANFPYGMGICALNKSKHGLYLSRIHTPKDTILDETNINILRAAIITLIGSTAFE